MFTLLRQLLPGCELTCLADYPDSPEPEETGSTYQENAAIKSESACHFTKLPCLADDAGLEIDALDGAPGLYSKRFGGEELPFPDKMSRILSELNGLPDEKRGARFRCCIALSLPEGDIVTTRTLEATCEGRIANETSGKGGFGYDPIFYLPERGCTMADLTESEKHEISHRGKVLREFARVINQGIW